MNIKEGQQCVQNKETYWFNIKIEKYQRCTPKKRTEDVTMPNPSTTVKTDFGITHDSRDLVNNCNMKLLPYDEINQHYPSEDEFDIDA